MTTYFISDIHLHANSNENTALLLKFLQTTGEHADAIYILGDLFAIWLGDDLNPPYAQPIVNALQQLASKKIPLYFMRGNRDFLVGKQFCQAAGCTLLDDPCVINLYGKPVLLTHGDLLCDKDVRYQNFRKFVQHPIIKRIFLSLPKWLRYKIGYWVKNQVMNSSKNNFNSQPEMYDVTAEAVNYWLSKYPVPYIIHGHTHKPAVHTVNNVTRIVLGDWRADSAQILAFRKDGYELLDLV